MPVTLEIGSDRKRVWQQVFIEDLLPFCEVKLSQHENEQPFTKENGEKMT